MIRAASKNALSKAVMMNTEERMLAMPIRIPDALPATSVLEGENIFVMTEHRAIHQDIRPLRVLILNLMPTKIETETQILRKLSNTPLQVEVDLLQTVSHRATHVPAEHLESFYVGLDAIRHKRYAGMFYICWGAQAGIYYHFGIDKHILDNKMSGIFAHQIVKPSSPLVRGIDDILHAPHSRNTEVHVEDIEAHPSLEVIAVSDEAGAFIAKSTDSRHFFVFGHPEYDTETLAEEYFRDVKKGIDPEVPKHYFPNDDPTQTPLSNWRAAAQLLYTNWLNYYVYQATPYDIDNTDLKAD